jgi:hypothetical protein
MLIFVEPVSQEWCQKCCFSITMPGHTQVYVQLRLSRNLDGHCYCTTCTAVTFHSHIFTSSNAFSNVVVKFCGVLSHVPCKCHKIQNRYWFLSNPCRLNVAEKSKWTKQEEVTGGWKTLNNEQFLNLYSYSHIVRMLKWRILTRVVHIAPKVKIRNACKIVVVRKHWYRWENN